MEKRNLICIGCPMGCPITVTMIGDQVVGVEGNTCKNGDKYARKEVTNPTRIVTSTVRVSGSISGSPVASCKTASDIPKGKIFDVIRDIAEVIVPAPIHLGDVVRKNVADTGVDMIATKEVL